MPFGPPEMLPDGSIIRPWLRSRSPRGSRPAQLPTATIGGDRNDDDPEPPVVAPPPPAPPAPQLLVQAASHCGSSAQARLDRVYDRLIALGLRRRARLRQIAAQTE